jgi:hypothetical protein
MGRWAPEASAVDRIGRAVGLAWIVLFLADRVATFII